jgi:hypothetical protein
LKPDVRWKIELYTILNWLFWIFIVLYGLALAVFISGYVVGRDTYAIIVMTPLIIPWIIIFDFVDEISRNFSIEFNVATRMYAIASSPLLNIAVLYWLRRRARFRSRPS